LLEEKFPNLPRQNVADVGAWHARHDSVGAWNGPKRAV
jgi:hypothetical protein